ncbi:MAG: hypothetical protein RLZZ292_1674 [Bacteroidota bacterium]|jgi:tetratricopeptide (TPR) repeat protein
MKNNFDTIEKYLYNQMLATERAAFETSLKSNPLLQKEVAQQRLEHDAMRQLTENRLREKMKDWMQQPNITLSNEAIIVPFYQRKIVRYAAAASLLLGAFWIYTQLSPSQNGAQLAMQRFENPSFSQYRGGTDTPTTFDTLSNLVVQKKYDAALAQLSKQNTSIFDFETQLLKATCLFQLQRYQEAAPIYRQLIATPNLKPNTISEMEWNLALTLLAEKGKENQEFKTLLQKIKADPNHFGYSKANELGV